MFKKISEKNFNDIFEQFHSAEKCKRGTLWDFLTSIVLQNIKKVEGKTLWWNPKSFKKSRIVPKKIRVKKRGGDSMLSMFWTSMFLLWTRF